MKYGRFNIRVYGIWIEADRVLVNEEEIHGRNYTKFPGGGLEYGEGLLDCLRREWKEELDIDLKILEHFYTTDFFQQSVFDESQVISVYYLVKPVHADNYIINKHDNEHASWLKLADITPETFSLPIDRKVAKMLLEKYGS